jgi:hypothetical protein
MNNLQITIKTDKILIIEELILITIQIKIKTEENPIPINKTSKIIRIVFKK